MVSESCPECAARNSTDLEKEDSNITWTSDAMNPNELLDEEVGNFLNFEKVMFQAYVYGLPVQVLFGILFNILGLVFIIRRRMWRKHEGYIYVVAIFVTNLILLVIVELPFWMSMFNHVYHIAAVSQFTCKVWTFLLHIILSANWMVIGLLFHVYFRDHLTRSTGGTFRNFAAKYCSPLGTKLVIGVFLVSSALLNLWHIPSANLHDNASGDNSCHIEMKWYDELRWWKISTRFISQNLPVIFTPVLCLVILCSGRRSSVLHFTYLEGERSGEVLLNSADAKEFKLASLVLAALVFVSEFPLLFLKTFSELYIYLHNAAVAVAVTEFISTLNSVLSPLVFLLVITQLKEAVRSLFVSLLLRAGSCCRCRSSDDTVNSILPLGAMQQRPPVEY